MSGLRRWIFVAIVSLAACGGKIETGDGAGKGSTVPGVNAGGSGGSGAGSAVCPAVAPNGYESCSLPETVPCTYIGESQWTRCYCGTDGIWKCEGCSGCHCPAEIPETGDSCEAYPNATPCPSSGPKGYCSCSPCLVWECSLEQGSVAGGGGWTTCDD